MENKVNSISERIGLRNEELSRIQAVFSRYKRLDKVVLYGSRAKGTHKPYSDIDITLYGDGLTLAYQQDVEVALDDLLLPYKFDVNIYALIKNSALKAHIARVGLLLYVRR